MRIVKVRGFIFIGVFLLILLSSNSFNTMSFFYSMEHFKVGCQYDSQTRLKEYERLNRSIRRNVDFVRKLGLKPIERDSLNSRLVYSGSLVTVFHSNARIAMQSKNLHSTIALIEGEMVLKKDKFAKQAAIECIDASITFYRRRNHFLDELAYTHRSYSSIKVNEFHVDTDKTFLLDVYGEYIIENFKKK